MDHVFYLRRRHLLETVLAIAFGVAMLLLAFGPGPLGNIAADRDIAEFSLWAVIANYLTLIASAAGMLWFSSRAFKTRDAMTFVESTLIEEGLEAEAEA